MHHAVQGHFLPVLECLLKNGSDPNLVFDGVSAWHVLLSDSDWVQAREIGNIPSKPVLRGRKALARNWWSAVCLMMGYGADMDSGLPELPSRTWKNPFIDVNREPRKIIEQRRRFLGLVGEE